MALNLGTGSEDEPEVMVDINTTPLVDVLLVLLVMLIITIPVQLHSVTLEMPRGVPPAQIVRPVVVKLDVLPTGQVLWDGEPLADRAALDARLRDAAAQSTQPEIHVRPDRLARYDLVAGVLAASQREGLQKIGIVGSEQFAN